MMKIGFVENTEWKWCFRWEWCWQGFWSLSWYVFTHIHMFRLLNPHCRIIAFPFVEELYYCNMMEWFWCDSALSLRPTGFLQCFDTVGLVIWPVKNVPEMTYYVLSGTLNLHTHSLCWSKCVFVCMCVVGRSLLPYVQYLALASDVPDTLGNWV